MSPSLLLVGFDFPGTLSFPVSRLYFLFLDCQGSALDQFFYLRVAIDFGRRYVSGFAWCKINCRTAVFRDNEKLFGAIFDDGHVERLLSLSDRPSYPNPIGHQERSILC